jgi:hypothetical protein
MDRKRKQPVGSHCYKKYQAFLSWFGRNRLVATSSIIANSPVEAGILSTKACLHGCPVYLFEGATYRSELVVQALASRAL